MGRKQGEADADPRWRSHIEPAPGELRIVQAWLNTAGAGDRLEELRSPRALADWLERWSLLRRGSELQPADLEQAILIRSGLRSLIATNVGPPPAAEVTAMLDRAAAAVPIRVRFASDGSVRLEPTAEGLGEALARLFEIVALGQRDGHWRRLKLCRREGCQAAFYDFSNGLSAKWCSRRCGNKGSSRTYRGRSKRYREQRRRERPLAT